MESSWRTTATSIGLLIARLGVGGYMLTHGWGKAQMVLDGNFDQFGDPIGLGVKASLLLAAGAEFGGAILVILGLLTRCAALSVAFTMGVAAFVVHGSDPWTMAEGFRLVQEGLAQSSASKEPALLYAIPFLALVFTGAGRFSIDARFVRGRD